MQTIEADRVRLRTRSLVLAIIAVVAISSLIVLTPAARASSGVLSPPHTDAGSDTDGNGLFEYLVISVHVSVTTPGGFIVMIQLYNGAGTTFIVQGNKIVNLQTGTNVVDVRLSGPAIWRSGFDGPYQAQIVLFNNTFAFMGFGLHTTAAYLAIGFEPVPARFSPPHSDRGVDTDGDGRFDYLAVDASVSVARAGTYTVSGVLRDNPPVSVIATATNTSRLAVGASTVRLVFSATDIRVAGRNGPYEANLTLATSTGVQIDTGTHVTGTYFLSDFDPLNAAFAPPHASYVVDLDGDGFNDYLVVNAFVTVTDPGMYSVSGDIAFVGLTSTWRGYLPAGPQSVRLDFLGWDLFNRGINGPYTLNLTLSDARFRVIDRDVHTTAAYRAVDFEPSPPARWIPPFVSRGRDDQGDGLFDYLAVNTTVNADRHGSFTWSMELWDATFTTYVGSASGQFRLSTGRNPEQLLFPGITIAGRGINGPYGVRLHLYDPEGRQVDLQSFTTGPFPSTAFEGKPGRLTPPYFDLGVDRDGDSRLDVIAVDVPVTVTRAATFLVGGGLLDSTLSLVASVQTFVDLRPGLSTVRLNFSAADAFRSGQEGAFYGFLGLSVLKGGNVLPIDNDQFITRNYTAAPFDQGIPVRIYGHARAAVTGAPLEDIGVIAYAPATRLQRQAITDASGYFEIPLPPGDYYVFADGPSENAADVHRTILTDSVVDFSLEPPAPNTLTADVSFSSWNSATLRGDFTFGADSALTRFFLDVGFGNGDGTLSQSELDRLLSFGNPPELPLTTRDTFDVDATPYNRVNGSETFTLSGAGPITSPAPLHALISGAYTSSAAIPSSPFHPVRLLAAFDTVSASQAFTLTWPSNFVTKRFVPVGGIVVTGTGGPTAGVDPGMDPNPRDFVDESWVNLTVGTTDNTPPLVTGAALDGRSNLRTRSGPAVTVTATASDVGRGDWPIQGANFTQGARNWASATPMAAQDGAFNNATEVVTGSLATTTLTEGAHSICVYARDSVPNNDTTGSCATVIVDNTPPTVSNVRVNGQATKTVVIGTPVTITATVSDASTGNGNIAGANVTRGAANWATSTAMTAADGAFDSSTEPVTATLDTTGWSPGTYSMCVYGKDDVGNGNPTATNCATLTVITRDTTAPSVTGARAQPNPANLSVTVNISAVVTDDIGVTTVYIQILDASGQTVANLTATFDSGTGRYSAGRAFTAPGTYTYRVWARDAAGNWGTATGTFVISAPPSGESPLAGLWWLIPLVIAIVAAVLVFLLWSRRRRQTPAAPGGPPMSPPSDPPGYIPFGTSRPPQDVDDLDRPLEPPPPP